MLIHSALEFRRIICVCQLFIKLIFSGSWILHFAVQLVRFLSLHLCPLTITILSYVLILSTTWVWCIYLNLLCVLLVYQQPYLGMCPLPSGYSTVYQKYVSQFIFSFCYFLLAFLLFPRPFLSWTWCFVAVIVVILSIGCRRWLVVPWAVLKLATTPGERFNLSSKYHRRS